MAAGFQSFNDDGVVQIDGQHLNIALVRKVTVPFSRYPGGGTNFWSADISVSPEDIIAFSCATLHPIPFHQTSSRFYVGSVSGVGAPESHTVTFYVFSQYYPPAGSFGMQVLAPSGQVIFDSSWRLYRPVSIISSVIGVHSFPAGKNYAASYMGVFAISTVNPQTSVNQIAATGLRINGSSADFANWIAASSLSGSSGVGRSDGPTRCIIIDVTGF